MILEDVLRHFNVPDEGLPDHLLSQTFNEVFLDGRLTKEKDNYMIVVTTRQDVTHQMHIRPKEEFPLIIMSVLPNGKLNGIKFGRNAGEEIPTNRL